MLNIRIFSTLSVLILCIFNGCGTPPLPLEDHLALYKTQAVPAWLNQPQEKLQDPLEGFEPFQTDYFRKESDIGNGGIFVQQFEFIGRPGSETLPLRRFHQATKFRTDDQQRGRELFDALIEKLNKEFGIPEVDMYAGEETHTWKKDKYELSAYIREMKDYYEKGENRSPWLFVTLNFSGK